MSKGARSFQISSTRRCYHLAKVLVSIKHHSVEDAVHKNSMTPIMAILRNRADDVSQRGLQQQIMPDVVEPTCLLPQLEVTRGVGDAESSKSLHGATDIIIAGEVQVGLVHDRAQ